MNNLSVIETGDGSHSLYNKELDETYHSRHGALQESKHVFIQHGLDAFVNATSEVSVFEVGFGTGLNALLTWQWSMAHQVKVNYTTLEPFPVPDTVWKCLNYADELGLSREFEQLHISPWHEVQSLSAYFAIKKLKTTLQEIVLESSTYDLVYFDAFAPNKQPDMWQPELFSRLAQAMKRGALLVTYCAKGQVKRDLKLAGLQLETLPGPPGKREMVRGKH